MKEDLLKIINHYGIDKQLKYIHSEYFELDEAIMQCECDQHTYYLTVQKNHQDHIAEELADIMVMLKQFQYYFNIETKQITDIMKCKIERQLERIDLEELGE